MNYELNLAALKNITDAVRDNIRNCDDGDKLRSSYTCGKISGLVAAMQLNGENIEFGSWSDSNGCLRAGFLNANGMDLIREGVLQQDALDTYKQSLFPPAKVTIYQINLDRDNNRVGFMNHQNLPKYQGNPEVDCSIYDRVYQGILHCSSLENIYQILNVDHPEDYRARSLSTSDVVHVEDSPMIQSGYYFCDSAGFIPVEFQPAKTKDGPHYGEDTVPHGKVLVIEPGREPEIREMSLDFKSMQRAVGGCIDACYPYKDPVAVIQVEDRNAGEIPLNRALRDLDGDIVHVTAGTMLVVGLNDNGFSPLSEKHLAKYEKLFHTPESFHYQDGQLIVEKIRKPKTMTRPQKSRGMER